MPSSTRLLKSTAELIAVPHRSISLHYLTNKTNGLGTNQHDTAYVPYPPRNGVFGNPYKVNKKGNGQKRELPVDSWSETGGQKYEGSKHLIWAHVIGQHHLPPVSGCTPTGTSRFSLLWSAPTRFGPLFVALCCSSPV